MAVGVPTDPAPTRITSLVCTATSFALSGQYPERNLYKQGPIDAICYRFQINAFFLKDPPDHRPAGL
jgi:hypothetical protein